MRKAQYSDCYIIIVPGTKKCAQSKMWADIAIKGKYTASVTSKNGSVDFWTFDNERDALMFRISWGK